MGIKALVDFSLIQEICEGIPKKGSKRTFKAKLKSRRDEKPTSAFKKVDEVKRLLVPEPEKDREQKEKGNKRKRKRSPDTRKPARNTFTLAGSSSGESESDSSSQSDTGESSEQELDQTDARKDPERTS